MANGRELHRFGRRHEDRFFAEMTLLADRRTIAQTAPGGIVRFWDVTTGQQVRQYKPTENSNCGSVAAVAPDGKSVFTIGTDYVIRRWEVATGKEIGRFGKARKGESHLDGPLTLSDDGKTLAATLPKSGDPTNVMELCLWEVASGEELATITAPGRNMDSPVFLPDNQRVVWPARIFDTNLYLFEATTGRKLKAWGPIGRERLRKTLVFSPDGKLVAVWTGDQAIQVWDLETGKQRWSLAAPNMRPSVFAVNMTRYPQVLAFSPDSKVLVAGGEANSVRCWDLEAGKERVVSGHVAPILAVDSSADGGKVVSCGEDRMFRRTGSCRAAPNWVGVLYRNGLSIWRSRRTVGWQP